MIIQPVHSCPLGDVGCKEPPKYTESEMRMVEAFLREINQPRVHAKYKIEVLFGSERSTWKPAMGVVVLWFSRSKLNGCGDAKAYWCPQCDTIIQENAHDIAKTVCASCGWTGTGAMLVGERLYRLPLQRWVDVLLHHYIKCGYDADILLKYSPDVLRKVQAAQVERPGKSDELQALRCRRLRNGSVYPLANIIKDVSGGSDLASRFRAFLSA